MIILRNKSFSDKKEEKKKSSSSKAAIVGATTTLGASGLASKEYLKTSKRYVSKLGKLSKAVEAEGNETAAKVEAAGKEFKNATAQAQKSAENFKANPSKEAFRKYGQDAAKALEAGEAATKIEKEGLKRAESTLNATNNFNRRAEKVIKGKAIKGGLKGAAAGAAVGGALIGAGHVYRKYKDSKKK